MEAITSHVYSTVKGRVFGKRVKPFFAVRQAVDDYLGSLFVFRAMYDRRRIHVRYEDIIRPDSGGAARLLQAMGYNIIPSEDEIAETLLLSFDSLQRPGGAKRDQKVVEKIKDEISKRLTYSQVLALARVPQQNFR
ncbi:hypothetical protein J2X76_004918 [Neorhizobium sp. 2083]|uniref:hypothetical protein n=1 Tax=Neorhizobium sp. 2083 TaxID=2817762 RepID=UPI00285F40E1|nr:hypothetical protein [Neorhizobium sp. 2083]MDR6819721.1 hypothetical protein [Neorhizobium sp. 2083]